MPANTTSSIGDAESTFNTEINWLREESLYKGISAEFLSSRISFVLYVIVIFLIIEVELPNGSFMFKTILLSLHAAPSIWNKEEKIEARTEVNIFFPWRKEDVSGYSSNEQFTQDA